MSGGSLNYGFHHLETLADDIKKIKIKFNDNNLNLKERQIIINEIKSLKFNLKNLSKRAKNLEWWLSGDDGDKTYLENILRKDKIIWKNGNFNKMMELDFGWMYEGNIKNEVRFWIFFDNNKNKIFLKDLKTDKLMLINDGIANAQRLANEILKKEKII